jgi:hypothetical protein
LCLQASEHSLSDGAPLHKLAHQTTMRRFIPAAALAALATGCALCCSSYGQRITAARSAAAAAPYAAPFLLFTVGTATSYALCAAALCDAAARPSRRRSA